MTELPQLLDDHPRRGLGSAWNNVAWYGCVVEDLGGDGDWSRSYCGGGDAAACQEDWRASLRATPHAVRRVGSTQVGTAPERGVDR